MEGRCGREMKEKAPRLALASCQAAECVRFGRPLNYYKIDRFAHPLPCHEYTPPGLRRLRLSPFSVRRVSNLVQMKASHSFSGTTAPHFRFAARKSPHLESPLFDPGKQPFSLIQGRLSRSSPSNSLLTPPRSRCQFISGVARHLQRHHPRRSHFLIDSTARQSGAVIRHFKKISLDHASGRRASCVTISASSILTACFSSNDSAVTFPTTIYLSKSRFIPDWGVS